MRAILKTNVIAIAKREKAAVGFYLSTHPLDDYKDLLAGMRLKSIAEYDNLQSGQNIKIAGMITSTQIRTSKRGNRFAQCRIEDRSGSMEEQSKNGRYKSDL